MAIPTNFAEIFKIGNNNFAFQDDRVTSALSQINEEASTTITLYDLLSKINQINTPNINLDSLVSSVDTLTTNVNGIQQSISSVQGRVEILEDTVEDLNAFPSTTTITLSAANWSNGQQIVSNVNIVSATNNVMISPSPTNYEAYYASGIYCAAQGNHTLTFKHTGAQPTDSISVNVMAWPTGGN